MKTEIFNPNLPDRRVKMVVMSTIYQNLNKKIEELGIKIIPTENIDKLLTFERYHADMQIFHYDRETVFVLQECKKLQNYLKKYFKNVIIADKKILKKYPYNVLMNGVSICNKIICKANCLDTSIQNIIFKNKNIIINTNQGYTKCSVCVVSDDAIITSDKSIYKSAQKNFDVLLIKPGEIELPFADYGFIGGCSFKIDKNILAFTGNIKLHSDYERIKDFLF